MKVVLLAVIGAGLGLIICIITKEIYLYFKKKEKKSLLKVGREVNLTEDLLTILTQDPKKWADSEMAGASLVGHFIRDMDGKKILVLSDSIGANKETGEVGHWITGITDRISGSQIKEIFMVGTKAPLKISHSSPDLAKDLKYFCNKQCLLDCQDCIFSKYGLRKNKRQ